MSVLITADSTCDLPKMIATEREITIIPLSILLGTNSYKDGVEITRNDIYRHVKETGELPLPRRNTMKYSKRLAMRGTALCT